MMNLVVSLAPEFCVIAFHQPEYNDVLAWHATGCHQISWMHDSQTWIIWCKCNWVRHMSYGSFAILDVSEKFGAK